MSLMTLSGWTQPHDALSHLYPDATTIDYAQLPSAEAMFDAMAEAAPRHLIAWSFGGQLALRAISAGVVRPEKLVIIAAPWQFVADEGFPHGMPPDTFAQFHSNYRSDSERTMQRFHGLIAKGDKHQQAVLHQLRHHRQVAEVEVWLPWLEVLGKTSLEALDLSAVPPTLILHGAQDAIVPIAHGERLTKALPQAQLEIWKECGHAPHYHAPERVKEKVEAFWEG